MSLKTTIPLDGNVNNAFKLTKADSPCCGDGTTICQYTADVTIGTYPITSLTITDALTSIPVVDAGLTAAGTAAAILTALKNAGYIGYPDGLPTLDFVVSGAVMSVTIYSDVHIEAAFNSNSEDFVFDVACNNSNQCTYTKTGIVSSTTDYMVINGVRSELIDIVAGTTTTAAIDTSITAAFTAAGVTAAVTVTSSGSGGSTVYVATITAPFGTRVKYTTTDLTATACGLVWSA